MPHCPPYIICSEIYQDGEFEYRHVILPSDLYKKIKKIGRLLTEHECRSLGVQGSSGWEHYDYYKPEPHILMLRKKTKKFN